MKIKIGSILLLVSVTLVACGRTPQAASVTSKLNEAWNPINNPKRLSNGYVVTFDSLPLEASLAEKPWSDTFWPSTDGGISARWDADDPQPFKYLSPKEDAVRAMSLRELTALSPQKSTIFIWVDSIILRWHVNESVPILMRNHGRACVMVGPLRRSISWSRKLLF